MCETINRTFAAPQLGKANFALPPRGTRAYLRPPAATGITPRRGLPVAAAVGPSAPSIARTIARY